MVAHWNGFLLATTKYKDTWVVDIEVLNVGKQMGVGLMPVLFISASFNKIFKHMEEHILIVFLELIQELESAFLDGFDIVYNYPSCLISSQLPTASNEDQNVKLHAMLMMWSCDHPAQCKVGGFKDGGYHACR